MLATSDKNGNLIIWKIENNNQFRILADVSNFSESNITNLQWSPTGDFLFAVNSNGSVYILEFNEFFISINNNNVNTRTPMINQIENKYDISSCSKKRLAPTMIPATNNSNNNNFMQGGLEYTNTNTNINNSNSNITLPQHLLPSNSTAPLQTIQDCLRCQKQKLDQLETKVVYLKLDALNLNSSTGNYHIIWENKIYDNYCTVQLAFNNDQILFANKFYNKLIRLFSFNNFFYAVYDAMNSLMVFTLFNTLVSK
jgi:WD40 repeat protein